MDDIRKSLVALAERGDPIGAEEMIDRVEASLSGDTVFVVNENAVSRTPKRQRSGLWVMAAVASMVAITFLFWAIADSEVYFDSAGSPAGSPEALFPERVATFEAAVDAYNAGDLDAFRGYFTEQPSLFGTPALSDAEWEPQRALMAANETWEITGPCEIRGRTLIGCPVTWVNDFMAPGGIRIEIALLINFDGDGAIRSMGVGSFESTGSPRDYTAAFDQWLERAHPDVHSSFGPRVGEIESIWGDMPGSQDMATALEYVDEFLEVSDVYPLTD